MLFRRHHSLAHSDVMVTVQILEEPGASKHLLVRGVIGDTGTFTDADIRADPRGGTSVLEKLRHERFVYLEEFRVGQRDATYTVRWDMPVVTTVTERPVKAPPVPPTARKHARARSNASRRRG